jgi:hypothetical protein
MIPSGDGPRGRLERGGGEGRLQHCAIPGPQHWQIVVTLAVHRHGLESRFGEHPPIVTQAPAVRTRPFITMCNYVQAYQACLLHALQLFNS